MTLEKAVYTAKKPKATGGRDGRATTSDGLLRYSFSRAKSHGRYRQWQ